MSNFQLVKDNLRYFVHDLLFPKESRKIVQLVEDNKELTRICEAQIVHIRELEDANAHLDFRVEDLEVELENLKAPVEERCCQKQPDPQVESWEEF